MARLRDPRTILLIAATLLGGAVAFPLGVLASHQFADVPTSSTFHADIAAIRNAGLTTGCAPNLYCPKDFVTREQMAAFLNRLGALGAGKTPVVNATKLDGKDSTAFMPAGDVVIRQTGAWEVDILGPLELNRLTNTDVIQHISSGIAGTYLRLQAPVLIGGRAYGFKSSEICLYGSETTTILQTAVIDRTILDSDSMVLDENDRPTSPLDCYTVTDANPTTPVGSVLILLTVEFENQSTISIGNVTTTWTPTS
jgi:hypothetical protein